MKKCNIYPITGGVINALISDGKVYLDPKDNLFYDFLDPYLLPIESDGKWGLMNGHTNELVVPLQFDFTSPLVYGSSHAVKNGLHGYIDAQGKTVLPFEYEDACDASSQSGYFAVKSEKWGVVNQENTVVVPFAYDKIYLDMYFDLNERWFQPYAGISAIQHGGFVLFDSYCNVLADNLTAYPRGYGNYLLLQSKRKFGVVCRDGRAITNVTMLRREALYLIKKLGGLCE